MEDQTIYHTDELLRAHELLVRQHGDTFTLVDWLTYRPADAKRVAAFEADLAQK